MKTRRIEESDLPELMLWYRGHGWGKDVTPDIFPSVGFMVDDHAALWFYEDKDGKLGWVAYQVTNPRKNIAMAFRALHLLYDRSEQEAVQNGLVILKQTVSHSSLKKLALQHNYIVTEDNLTSFVKRVS